MRAALLVGLLLGCAVVPPMDCAAGEETSYDGQPGRRNFFSVKSLSI
jgi:hypothetical protein